jgi:serine/threonine protein kinase
MDDWIGKQLGQYEIASEIGRGGMAVVYKAWQAALGRSVAIKVLPRHFAFDQEFVARFQREAMSAAQLNHPNIVTIHDVGQVEDTHFIVMEYLEGQSLFDMLKASGPMPLERVSHIVRQVASALDYAHQRGVVHRDIKPANIIVRPDGHATLTDFGIAKAVAGTSLTQTGTMVGTPQYMAPEQVQGATVDRRADVYALGIVCYEMLAGAPPFTGDTAAVLYAQAHRSPPPLRQRLPGLPDHVEGALDRALTKDPAMRFASAGELADALTTRTVSPTPAVPAPPPAVPTAPYPTPRPPAAARRRPSAIRPWLLLGGGAAAILVLVTVLAVALLAGGGSGGVGKEREPTRTRPVVTTAPASKTQAASVVSSPTDTPAPTVPTSPPIEPTMPPETSPRPTDTPAPTATATPSPSPTPTPTPSPLRLVFVLGSPGDGDIYLIDADGSNLRRLVGGRDDQAEPAWTSASSVEPSPDGGRIAYQSDRAGNYDIWSIDADGQHERQLTTTSVDEREPDWSPDGGQIVYRRGGEPNGDGELWVMDADGGDQRRLGGGAVEGRAPAWSPDGGRVVFMSERSGAWDIYLFDLSSGDTRRLSHCSAHCRFPDWSPDGQYVVYHSTSSASSFTPVEIWRQRADGSGSAELLTEGNNPGRAVWSVEGLIALNTDDGLDIMDADGGDRHALQDSDDGWAPDWSR